MRRVAITGIGIISGLGRGKAETIDALRHGRSGIRNISSIDASALNCRIAGEVPVDAFGDAPRGHDRFTRLALIAAEEAAAEAAYASIGLDSDRIGALIGTGLGGCETLDASYRRIYGEGSARVPPASWMLKVWNRGPLSMP